MRFQSVSGEMGHDVRATIHYLVILVVLGFYGGEVCPVVDGLTFPVWVMHLLVVFLLARVLRVGCFYALIRKIPLDRQFMTVTQKFSLIAFVSLFSVMLVLFFVFSQDMEWIISLETGAISEARQTVLGELCFIIFVLMAYTTNLIFSYAKNLKLFLSSETHALTEVANGNLDTRVPVRFNDEFGVIAGYTNQMICEIKTWTGIPSTCCSKQPPSMISERWGFPTPSC